MAAHKHAAVIKAWADGEPIQASSDGINWYDEKYPNWRHDVQWRIKPAEPKRTDYPETTLTAKEAEQIWGKLFMQMRSVDHDYRDFANAILRHACDNGQIVSRAEFDRATGKNK